MNILQKIVCKNVVIDKPLQVQVVNHVDRKPMFSGVLTALSLYDKTITISVQYGCDIIERVIGIDKIITLSRMRDGRLRMWIKEEDAK